MPAFGGKKRQILRHLALCVALLLACFLFLEGNLSRVILTMANATARTLAVTVLNEAANEIVLEGVNYDDLMRVSRDSAGQVRLLQADTTAMNRLATRASQLAQGKLEALEHRVVSIPLGAALGMTLFAGAGPRIQVQVVPVGAVSTRFDTELQSAGINQTRHKILLTLTAVVKMVIPTGASTVEASTQVAVAESIIVGEVPDSFVDVNNDNDMLNLIP